MMRTRPNGAVLPGLFLGLVIAGLAASPARGGEPVLAACGGGDAVRVMIGTMSSDGPVFESVAARGIGGRWSGPSPLPSPRGGLPLTHRSLNWFVEIRSDAASLTYHAMLPVTGEIGVAGVRIEAVHGLTSFAVASLDDWTFVLTDLAPGGSVLARVIESKGTLMEMESTGGATWSTGWPGGTRLLAASLAGAFVVAVGITPDDTVACSAIAGGIPVALPAPSLPKGGLFAACVGADGPLVAATGDGAIVAQAWTGEAWTEPHRIALPAGGAPLAMAMTTVGKERNTCVVVALIAGSGGQELAASAFSAGGFGDLERLSLSGPAPPDAAIRPPGAERPEADAAIARLRMARRALLGAGIVALAFLLSRLRRAMP